MKTLKHFDPFVLLIEALYLDGDFCLILHLTVSGDDSVASSAIIIRYFEAALLEVNIYYNRPTAVEDFFLLYHSKHSPGIYSFTVTGIGVVAPVDLDLPWF